MSGYMLLSMIIPAPPGEVQSVSPATTTISITARFAVLTEAVSHANHFPGAACRSLRMHCQCRGRLLAEHWHVEVKKLENVPRVVHPGHCLAQLSSVESGSIARVECVDAPHLANRWRPVTLLLQCTDETLNGGLVDLGPWLVSRADT